MRRALGRGARGKKGSRDDTIEGMEDERRGRKGRGKQDLGERAEQPQQTVLTEFLPWAPSVIFIVLCTVVYLFNNLTNRSHKDIHLEVKRVGGLREGRFLRRAS